MSYVRFSEESEVYLIGTTTGDDVHVIECCGCRLTADVRKARTDEERARVADVPGVERPEDFEWDWSPRQHFKVADGALAHLDAHRAAGHKVPDYVFADIRDDDWLTEVSR